MSTSFSVQILKLKTRPLGSTTESMVGGVTMLFQRRSRHFFSLVGEGIHFFVISGKKQLKPKTEKVEAKKHEVSIKLHVFKEIEIATVLLREKENEVRLFIMTGEYLWNVFEINLKIELCYTSHYMYNIYIIKKKQ